MAVRKEMWVKVVEDYRKEKCRKTENTRQEI